MPPAPNVEDWIVLYLKIIVAGWKFKLALWRWRLTYRALNYAERHFEGADIALYKLGGRNARLITLEGNNDG